jgi:hypothetical protein
MRSSVKPRFVYKSASLQNINDLIYHWIDSINFIRIFVASLDDREIVFKALRRFDPGTLLQHRLIRDGRSELQCRHLDR